MNRKSDKKINSFEDFSKRIDSTGLNTETKGIFKLMLDFIKVVINERDIKAAELVNKLEAEREDNLAKLTAMESELQQYKMSNNELSVKLSNMADAHDELEAYGRRESLVFSGDKIKPYQANKSCVDIARNLIKDVLSRVWTRRAADQTGRASYGHVVEFQAITVYTGNKDGRGDKGASTYGSVKVSEGACNSLSECHRDIFLYIFGFFILPSYVFFIAD